MFENDGLEALMEDPRDAKPVLDKATVEDILVYMVKNEVQL